MDIPKKLTQKRIPTLLGLGILVIGLVAGTLLFSQGTGVFSPRATPQTTPKGIAVTNITDNSFTVSFLTDEATVGFVKYGTEPNQVESQASDDRDQLSGTVSSYNVHHVTVRGLEQNQDYHYVLGTGSGSTFNNNGQPFIVKTAQRGGTPPAAKTIYGSVSTAAGAPADGSVVYVTLPDGVRMSSLVKSSGSWAIPLSNARTIDGAGFATVQDSDSLTIAVQGPLQTQTANVTALVSEAQPVASITFGQAETSSLTATDISGTLQMPDETLVVADPSATDEAKVADESTSDVTTSGRESALNKLLSEKLPEIEEVTVLDLSQTEKQTVTTTSPVIRGTAAPSVVIDIVVNSETQITQQVTSGPDGAFELDLEALSADLEPGEHTVTYSYIDGNGQTVQETVNFSVSDTSNLLAQANTNQQTGPFSTESPFPVSSPSPSPSAVASPSPTPSSTPRPSPTASASAVATDSSDKGGMTSTRSALPSTDSAIPVSGSVNTTFALIFGGLFFILSGGWSYWISTQVDRVRR
ncbi:MAG: fibronectin type III domain-containing protein [Microgenomates group bacterium]